MNNYKKYKEGAIGILVLLILAGVSAFALTGVFIANGAKEGSLKSLVLKPKLVKLANENILGLSDEELKGGKIGDNVIGTVLLSDSSYSTYRVLDVDVNKGKLDGDLRIKFLSNDIGIGEYVNNIINPFYLKDGVKTQATIVDGVVVLISLNNGQEIPLKITQGSVRRGKVVGEFIGQTFDSGYYIAGMLSDKGNIETAYVVDGSGKSSEVQKLVAQNALNFYNDDESNVLGESTENSSAEFDSVKGVWKFSQLVSSDGANSSLVSSPNSANITNGNIQIVNKSGITSVKSLSDKLEIVTANGQVTLDLDLSEVDTNVVDNSVLSDHIRDGQLTNSDFSDSAQITDSKLNTITSTNKVLGSAIQINSGGGIVNSAGLSLTNLCSISQVLSWDGDSWECSTLTAAGGDITEIVAGSGLVGGASSGSATLTIDTTYFSDWDQSSLDDLNTSSNFSGDVSGDYDSLVVGADAVALSVDTIGDYVSTVVGNSQISVSGSGSENASITLSLLDDSIGNSQLAFDTGQDLTTLSTPTFSGLTLNGLTVSSGAVALPAGEIGNTELANSSVTVSTGGGLVGGGVVSLGGSVSLSSVLGTSIDISDETNFGASDGITLVGDIVTNSDKGSSQNIFKTISISGQSDIVSDGNLDILNLVSGDNITLTTVSGTDTITISATDTDTNTTYSAGNGLTLTDTTFSIGSSVLTTDNYASELDLIYLNNSETPTVADISGSFADGLTINANSVTLATDTVGNYIGTINGNSQISVSGSGNENAEVTLSIISDSINDTQLTFNTGQHLTTLSAPTFSGLTISSGSVNLPAGEIGNTELSNSSLTVTAGSGLTGGGLVSLGDSVSISSVLGMSIDISDETNLIASDGITITGDSLTNTDKGSSQNIFKTIFVLGQSDVVSDANSDGLTLVSGSNITITTTAGTDTITISATDTDTNTTYSAGTDLDLTTTTFDLETTLDSVITLNLSGTGTINGLDVIDTTTENTLESVLDVAGDITGTGLNDVAIGNDKVLEAHLKAVDTAGDEECLTYESTIGDFEWQSCGSGGGGIENIKENNVTVVSSALAIDFLGSDFTVDSQGNDADVAIDYINSGITRKAIAESITAGWTFTTNATTFSSAINADGGLTASSGVTISAGGATITSGALAVNSGSITSSGTLTIDGTSLVIIPNADTFQTNDVTATGGDLTLATTDSGNVNLQSSGTGTTADIQIGAGGSGSTTPDLFKLDVKSNAGDPTGANGSMYYNANTNKFRCYEDGAWKDCDTTGSDAGSSPVTEVTLASDVTNNGAANTIADVTGLSFPVVSGTTYNFKFTIIYTSAATTTGSRWSINGPATSMLAYTSRYSLAATTQTQNYATAYNIPAASNATSSSTTGNIAIIEGVITPSANGAVIARFASEVSGSAIVAKAGSTVLYW